MTTQTEALKMAIEALEISEQIQDYGLISFEKYGIKEDKDILKKYQKALNACKEALQSQEQGNIVVTKNQQGKIVCVTRQDSEGKILSVIAESDSQEQEPVAYVNNMCNDSIDWKIDPIELKEGTPLYTHPAPTQLPQPSIAKGRDEIYYAWRKHWGYGIPSKHGEAVFNANGDGFQAGWLACEKWMKEKQNG